MNYILRPAVVLSAALMLASCGSTPTAENIAPVANFSGVPASVDVDQVVRPTLKSTDANKSDVLTHTWDWGDGTPQSSGNSPSHRYASAGLFKITLTTKDNHGASDIRVFEVTVAAVAANPAAFFSAHGVPIQTQGVEVGVSPQTLTFAGGTKVTLETDSVVDAGGTVYTGKVMVSVREIRSRGDMILSNVLPFSDDGTAPAPTENRVDRALVSGGMLHVDLKTPAGADLKVNPDRGVPIQVPAVGPLNDRMQLFLPLDCKTRPVPRCDTGAGNAPAAGESSVNWQPVAGHFGINSSTTPGSYVFNIFNKGWANTDMFYSDPRPKTTLQVKFNAVNDLNTLVFMIPDTINTVIALNTTDGPDARRSYTNMMPVGLKGELVAITFNAGKQYLAHRSITVAAGQVEALTLTEASTADIKAYLAARN